MATADRPVYLRLRDEIVAMILDGRIREGDALPSVRAFQEDGLVTVRRGVGMFVDRGAAQRLRAAARLHFLEQEWPDIASRIRRLDIDPAELLDRVLA
jgi:GntR family transcriptional regulator